MFIIKAVRGVIKVERIREKLQKYEDEETVYGDRNGKIAYRINIFFSGSVDITSNHIFGSSKHVYESLQELIIVIQKLLAEMFKEIFKGKPISNDFCTTGITIVMVFLVVEKNSSYTPYSFKMSGLSPFVFLGHRCRRTIQNPLL